jgi:hypothetical protein
VVRRRPRSTSNSLNVPIRKREPEGRRNVHLSRGNWRYLYRAVDSTGATIDFWFSPERDAAAAKAVLPEGLAGSWSSPAAGQSSLCWAFECPLQIARTSIIVRGSVGLTISNRRVRTRTHGGAAGVGGFHSVRYWPTSRFWNDLACSQVLTLHFRGNPAGKSNARAFSGPSSCPCSIGWYKETLKLACSLHSCPSRITQTP